MRFEDEYWVLTKEDAINYAKSLEVSSDCEHLLNPDKPKYTYDYCLLHAKKQLKRNLSLSERDRKILTLQKMILKQRNRFHNDDMIRSIFKTERNWFQHLANIKLNSIFDKLNRHNLEKVLNFKPVSE